MTYSSALFGGDRGAAARRRAAGQVRAHPRRARAAAGRAHPRDRLRLGRLRRSRRARRLPRDRAVAVRRADRVRARAHRRAPGSPTASSSASRTTATYAARYDGVASIEMFEAVGEHWWPAYFRAVRDALRPGGRACIQTITIADERFERYRTQSDFIQQYIFPGGMLASPSRFAAEARARGPRARGRARLRPRLRRDAAALARRVRRATPTPCARRASTSASSAAGASTSPTAPPASTAGPPMSRHYTLVAR